MRLLITGGGTGGHVYPLLAVLESLAAEHAIEIQTDVRFIGRGGSIEERLAGQAGIPFIPLRVRGLRTLAPWSLARNLWLMSRAETEAGKLVRTFKPDAVLATGGYVSAPGIYAAAQQGVPVVIYLPDLEPGLAIRTMSRWAKCVAISFEEVKRHFAPGKAVVTGYPVRRSFLEATREKGREHFQIPPRGNLVTVFGGSTGAHSINEAIRNNLSALLDVTQVIHVTGKQDEAEMQAARESLPAYKQAGYHVYGYLDEDMPLALAAADLVVARAGAATLGEFPAVGVASVLVPYPYAGKHQEKNADFLVSHGAAVKVQDRELRTTLLPALKYLLENREQREHLTNGARALAQPEAASNIAKLLK
ncbi:MAG: undecaprenyldiphospho-muramoylpentapeptide beta-N-acetylglucosaminyltransferase [Rudaea sp.]